MPDARIFHFYIFYLLMRSRIADSVLEQEKIEEWF